MVSFIRANWPVIFVVSDFRYNYNSIDNLSAAFCHAVKVKPIELNFFLHVEI